MATSGVQASTVHISPTVLHRTLRGVTVASNVSSDVSSSVDNWIKTTTQSFLASANSSDNSCWAIAKWFSAAQQVFGDEQQQAMPIVMVTLAVSLLRTSSQNAASKSLVNDVAFAWNLIHRALVSRHHGFRASRSAQGFLAVALCSLIQDGNIEELWRLHVWLPDGKRGNADFAVHSHQSFAESWVLAGEGTDHAYDVTPALQDSTATHATYRLSWNDGTKNNADYKTHQNSSTIVNTGELVTATMSRSETHSRGSSYTIGSVKYHRTEVRPDAVHATIFVFDSSRGFQKDAPVLGPVTSQSLTQQRDPAGVDAAGLARLVGTVRSWEESMSQGQEHSHHVRWEDAFQSFQKALHILDSHHGIDLAPQYRIRTLIELGNVNRRFGRYHEAQKYLQSALQNMEPTMERAELSGELAVVYRHMNKLFEAKTQLEDQYTLACGFYEIRTMCRAIGNLGMVNYQLFKKDGSMDTLDLAIRQLLLRVQLARGMKSNTMKHGISERERQNLRFAVTWETIGLARLSICYGAKGDVPQAIASAKESLDMTKDSGDATVIAMSRFFYGRALLLAGETFRSQAMEQFNQKGTCTPAMALCKEPSEEHREYLMEMISAGADLHTRDEQGYTALDYAVFSGDTKTERLIADGLRESLRLQKVDKADSQVLQSVTEAYVRKGYREILQESLRPVLLRTQDVAAFPEIRNEYAKSLALDTRKQGMFDQLKFIRYEDFVRAKRLPNSTDNIITQHSGETAQDNTVNYLIFLSYRWIHTRHDGNSHESTHVTPDDDQHTQYRRMLTALDEFLAKHPHVDPGSLGIWMDFACINQKEPMSGVQALPLIIVQCDAMISIVDETYYSRAWCAVEVMFIQTLRKAYGRHLWYEQVAVDRVSDNGSSVSGYKLQEGDSEAEISLAGKKLTCDSDILKVAFLERQVKLLA